MSVIFHCVKNRGTSRVFRCQRAQGGYVVQTGRVTHKYSPMKVFDTDEEAGLKTFFGLWIANNMNGYLLHPDELKLVAAHDLSGDHITVPVQGEILTFRYKTGGDYTERFSAGAQTISSTELEDFFDRWLDGLASVDVPDADEINLYRDQPFNGVLA